MSAIVITSGKGGTGKTSVTAATASCLAALGHRTLCIDADVGLKNLDIALGLSNRVCSTFADVISGQESLEEAAMQHPEIENLYFISAPQSFEGVSEESFAGFMEQCRESFEYCFVDCPAGIGQGFRVAISGCDKAIVVSNADPSSCRDVQKVVTELEKEGFIDVRLIVNRVKRSFFRRANSTIDDIVDTTGARLLGVVFEDSDVPLAASAEKPLVLYSSKGASTDILAIARRLRGERVPLKLRFW